MKYWDAVSTRKCDLCIYDNNIKIKIISQLLSNRLIPDIAKIINQYIDDANNGEKMIRMCRIIRTNKLNFTLNLCDSHEFKYGTKINIVPLKSYGNNQCIENQCIENQCIENQCIECGEYHNDTSYFNFCRKCFCNITNC